jgi:outer membrane murein-binding lipoprotein Lpp
MNSKGGATMHKLFVLAGIAGVLTVAGCAPVPLTKADVDGRSVCNEDQMDQVERHARRINAKVYWVNCPQVTLRTT